MSPHNFSRLGTRGVRLALQLCVVLGVCATALVFTARSRAQEREFRNNIPAHVPVKVKLKNEEKFKKLENKEWARELEIEVKNTGAKPIYYIYVIISMPDVRDGAYSLAFQVKYGRKELAFFDTPLQPDDVPIRPGESVTLKVPENQVGPYERWRDRQGKEDPKKVEFNMQFINYGDGTGFESTQGHPVPNPSRKRSQHAPPPDGKARACLPAPRSRDGDSPGKLIESFYPAKPASLLRVNFSPAGVVSTSEPVAPRWRRT